MKNENQILDMEQLKTLLIEKQIFYVIVRSGKKKPLDLEQIRKRIDSLAYGLDRNFVNINLIVHKVIQGMFEGITTQALDNLAAETCAYMNIIHPNYSLLAARLAVNNLHKETKESFSETIDDLYNYIDEGTSKNNLFLIFFHKNRKQCLYDRRRCAQNCDE